MMPVLSALILAAALSAADADPLAVALKGQEGDPFAIDRIQEVLMLAPRAQRSAVVGRIADSKREDIDGILSRLIQDDDPASAAIAIDALAKRWPTSMQDVELIRAQLLREGPVGSAACRYATAVGDDEALPALAERITRFPADAEAEAALRRLTALPGGCGPEGWPALVEARLARDEAAISGAERLLGGTPSEAMGALTLVAGMRPAGSRGARVLLAAAEHPDSTVRRMALSILTTCDAPAAAAWRNRGQSGAEASTAIAAASSAPASSGPVAAPPAAVATPAAAPAAAVAVAPVTGGGGWLWLVGLAALAGVGGWMFVRRQAAPQAVHPAGQGHQGRFTWGG